MIQLSTLEAPLAVADEVHAFPAPSLDPPPAVAPFIGRNGVTLEEARAELERVVGSADFPASLRNREFLRFVVERHFAHHGTPVPACEIARQVMGRGENFNTILDPIVRIEAGKLRRDLETYYLKSGQDNPLRLSVPRGGYNPDFERVESHRSASSKGEAPALTGRPVEDGPAELERLLHSPDFPATPRNRRFLSYVVEKELAGAHEEISAKLIAIRVLGRPESCNPNVDPIVRIEAGKLRRDLETYYLKAGRSHRMRILLPKGGYRPFFQYLP
jgi:hypothetical protein